MPYKTIHWIKLEKRLLNDYRFYLMSENAQLLYLKLLMLAAETVNKIPKNPEILKTCLRSSLSPKEIENCLIEIKTNFPKFKNNKDLYQFSEWSTRHHWVAPQELPENSAGVAGEAVDQIRRDQIRIDKIRIDKIRIEYIRIRGLSVENFSSDDFNRTAKAIKTLLIKAGLKDDVVIASIEWAAAQGWCDWTLETIIRRFPDFLKYYNQPEILKKFGKDK